MASDIIRTMDFTSKKIVVKTFVKDVNAGKYNMKHKFQRKEGQWKPRQKVLLIDSLLRPFPIDPIRCELKDDGIKYIFDGVQRSTTIRDYIADGFKLNMPLKPIVIDGESYEISGKKFSQLDENVKDRLLGAELLVYTFTDCTEDGIREMFARQNNGAPLTNTQKRTALETDEVGDIVYSLASHPFFERVLSPTQIKRDVPRDLVRETMMLICSDENHSFTSFRSNDINTFVVWYSGNMQTFSPIVLENAMKILNDSFETLKIKTTSIPMLLYSAYMCDNEGRDMEQFINAVKEFVNNYDNNDGYIQYCTQGTSSQESVLGRLNYWKNIVDQIPVIKN